VSLTKLQKKFAEYYSQGYRQGEAARLAGYSSKSADSQAVDNLKNSQIIEYIEELNKASKLALRLRFSGMATTAYNELTKVLLDEDTPPQTKANVAKMILDYAGMEEPKQVNLTADVKTVNPFDGLTTEELRKLVDDG
jgi:phage terminase small subunit